MRATIVIVLPAALGLLAACADQQAPQAVAATPPSVSYQIYGNDVAPANAQADGYCQQYGMYANLQGVQPNGTQSVATYVCGGNRVGSATPTYINGAPPPPYTAAAPVTSVPAPGLAVRCADPLHQNLPGGTDYRGPPVPGCP
jgi:hypothetical protein